jgi:hypothetical protein
MARLASGTPEALRCCWPCCSSRSASGILAQGSISVDIVNTPKVEAFYWAAIKFSQTLGTARGDWMADSTGLGYEGGALMFGAALAIVAAAYYWTDLSRVALFWLAFILTRPLGATVGDFLDKPVDHGALALSRPIASAVLAAFILICVLVLRAALRQSFGASGIALTPPPRSPAAGTPRTASATSFSESSPSPCAGFHRRRRRRPASTTWRSCPA